MEEGMESQTKKVKRMGKIRVGRLLHDEKKKDTHKSIEGKYTAVPDLIEFRIQNNRCKKLQNRTRIYAQSIFFEERRRSSA